MSFFDPIFLELYLVGGELDGRQVSGFFPWALTEIDDRPWALHRAPTDPADYFRFGVRYDDGRTAATTTWDVHGVADDRLSAGPPASDQVILLTRGGSGGGGRGSVGLWIWPSPTTGGVHLHATWPAAGVAELSVAIPEDAIRSGQRDISPLWPATLPGPVTAG